MGDPASLDPSRFDPLLLEAHIRAYASFGPHRTGWPGDDRTTVWLNDELRAAGVDARQERFQFPRVEVRSAALSWEDERIEGVPMYDGGFTPAGGVVAQLAEEDEADRFGKIVVALSAAHGRTRWTAPDVRAHYQALSAEGALGVVVPTADRLGEISLRNAGHIARPFSLPVLQIAQRDARRLGPVLRTRIEVTLEIDANRLDSTATNVTATIPGDDGDAATLVVLTPKSGWYVCAAERGGGLAAWLALAEAVAAMPGRRRTVHFVATSAHELDRRGLTAYLAAHASLARDARCWVHLGSSIGAQEPAMRVGASDGALLALAERSLTASGIEGYEALEPGDPGIGEAREVDEAGGRIITFHGTHPFFHSPNDTVEMAVDPDSVARWTRAAWDIVCALIEEEG